MPACTVLPESALLTTAGWAAVRSLPPAAELFGLDRAGRLASRSVSIAGTGARSKHAYVGTGAACGAFAPAAVLTVSDGKPCRVADIVNEGAVADLAFENVLRTFDRTAPLPCAAALWDSLRQTAAKCSEESLLLPCRYEPAVEPDAAPFSRAATIARRSYLELIAKPFQEAFTRDPVRSYIALCRSWLREPDDSREEFERELSLPALWYVSALTAGNTSYRLQYDCLQHSSYIFVSKADAPAAPVERGACAFLTPASSLECRLMWQDASWSPLSAGFILAAE